VSGEGRAPGRLLVVLHEPGYFRMYGSTIVELGRRGWDVRLAFDNPGKRGEGRRHVPEGAAPNVQSIGAVPGGGADGPLAAMRATLDYVRYLEPAFGGAGYLRRRAEKFLPGRAAFLTRIQGTPRIVVTAAIGMARAVEGLVPPDAAVLGLVRALRPDAVLVSPLVTAGPSGWRQTEVVKAARSLGIPVIVGVASWDHLSSKGLIRLVPDLLLVWNELQAREAVDLHRVPRSRVVVTGAQSLDHWFAAPPDGAAQAFRAGLGVDAARPIVLFVGSSRNMAPGDSEVRFVRRWLAAIRAASAPRVRDAFVVIRPHPTNVEPWRAVEFDDAGVVVHPTTFSGIPLTEPEVDLFRTSLLACDAVVGINTTAMIEGAIFERPVLSVRDEAFVHSQAETLHFGLLESAGGVATAGSLDAHMCQLAGALDDPAPYVARARAFVASFVRPRGAAQAATGHVCDEIERLALARS
jgi:hypothetical protein